MSCPSDFDFPAGGNVPIPMQSEVAFVESLEESTPLAQATILAIGQELGLRQSYLCVIFAVRMAIFAARTGSAGYLRNGLHGLVFGTLVDRRDLLGALSIIEDCAQRIAFDFLGELRTFRDAVHDAGVRATIEGYLSRLPEMRKVEVMGFSAAMGEEDIGYTPRG